MHFSVKQYRQHAVCCVLLVIKFLVFSDSDSGYHQPTTHKEPEKCLFGLVSVFNWTDSQKQTVWQPHYSSLFAWTCSGCRTTSSPTFLDCSSQPGPELTNLEAGGN